MLGAEPTDRCDISKAENRLDLALASGWMTEEDQRTARAYDSLRRPQHDAGWCGELAGWNSAQEAWDMLLFSLRLCQAPRAMVTTFVNPKTTVVTRGST